MDIVTLTLAKNGAKKYTDEVVEGLGKGIVYKGAVDYYNNLPNNATQGDCYSILYKGTSGTEPSGAEYVWGKINNVSQWIKLGEDIDLTNYIKNTDYATKYKGGVVKVSASDFGLDVYNGNLYPVVVNYQTYLQKYNDFCISKGTMEGVFTGKNFESANNKTTVLTSASTDAQYPSAKCVYDLIGNVEALLENLDTGNGVE